MMKKWKNNKFKKIIRLISTLHTFWIIVILLALCLLFTILTPAGSFLSINNFRSLSADAAQLVILTVGATYLLISGGLDLSVGSSLVLATVSTLNLMKALGGSDNLMISIPVGIGFALAFTSFIGLINGVLVTKFEIPSFIATLGTMGAALGFARLLSKGTNVSGVPRELMNMINSRFLGIPFTVFIAALVVIIFSLVLKHTTFGLHTLSVGSNLEGTRRAGIKVKRHQVKIYILMGFLVGIVTIIDLGRFGIASIAAHTTVNLQAIAGAVIGGTSMFGGRGSVFGGVIGAFIPAVLRNGFIILGLQPFWQEVAVSFVLLLAVYFDQWRRTQLERLQSQIVDEPNENNSL